MKKLISTEKAGLRSPYEGPDKDLDIAIVDVQEETGIRYGKPQVLSSAEFNEAYSNADSDVQELIQAGGGGGGTGVDLTVTPSTSTTTYTPSSGTYYKKVVAEGVTPSIDANIDPANIKEGVSILGVTGTYVGGGILERAVLDTVTAYEDDVINVDVQYEYHEPGEWDDPSSPNWKELDIYVLNTGDEPFDPAYTILALTTEAGDEEYKWVMSMTNLQDPYNPGPTLYPDNRMQIGSVGYAQEPAEGAEPSYAWEKINTFVDAAKDGDITTNTDVFTDSDCILSATVFIDPDVISDWELSVALFGNKDAQGTHADDIELIHWDYIGSDPAPWSENLPGTYDICLIHYVEGEEFFYPLPLSVDYASRNERCAFATGWIPEELRENNEDWYFGCFLNGDPVLDDSRTGGEENSSLQHPYEAVIAFKQPVELLQNYSMPTFVDPEDPEHVATPVEVFVDPTDKFCLILQFDRPVGTDWMHECQGILTVEPDTVTTITANFWNTDVVLQDFIFSERVN